MRKRREGTSGNTASRSTKGRRFSTIRARSRFLIRTIQKRKIGSSTWACQAEDACWSYGTLKVEKRFGLSAAAGLSEPSGGTMKRTEDLAKAEMRPGQNFSDGE